MGESFCIHEDNRLIVCRNHGTVVHVDEWASEAALWTLWIHLGDLEASTECQIITIESQAFSAAVKVHTILMPKVSAYAQKFCSLLNDLCSRDISMLTDLWQRELDPTDILVAPTGGKRHIGERQSSALNVGGNWVNDVVNLVMRQSVHRSSLKSQSQSQNLNLTDV